MTDGVGYAHRRGPPAQARVSGRANPEPDYELYLKPGSARAPKSGPTARAWVRLEPEPEPGTTLALARKYGSADLNAHISHFHCYY
jgi:hypothetical protein